MIYLNKAFNAADLLPLLVIMGIMFIIPIITSLLRIKKTILFSIEFLIVIILASFNFLQTLIQGPFIDGLYIISLAFFLFLSGLDTDFGAFKHEGKPSIIGWTIKLLLFVYLIGFGMAFIFIKEIPNDKFWIGIILVTIFLTSTFASVVIPVVNHLPEALSSTCGKILTTYASIAELLSIVFLSVVMIITKFNSDAKPWLLIIVMALLIFIIFMNHRFAKKVDFKKIDLKITIFLLLLLIILSDQAGAELILGAFLLGATLKWVGIRHNSVETIEKLGYDFFIPIFFIIVGFKVPIKDLFNLKIALLTLLLFISLLVVKAPFLLLFKYFKTKSVLPIYFLSMCTLIVALGIEHLDYLTVELTKAMIIASAFSCIVLPLIFSASFRCQPQIDLSLNKEG